MIRNSNKVFNTFLIFLFIIIFGSTSIFASSIFENSLDYQLYQAVLKGNANEVKMIINKGANIESIDFL